MTAKDLGFWLKACDERLEGVEVLSGVFVLSKKAE